MGLATDWITCLKHSLRFVKWDSKFSIYPFLTEVILPISPAWRLAIFKEKPSCTWTQTFMDVNLCSITNQQSDISGICIQWSYKQHLAAISSRFARHEQPRCARMWSLSWMLGLCWIGNVSLQRFWGLPRDGCYLGYAFKLEKGKRQEQDGPTPDLLKREVKPTCARPRGLSSNINDNLEIIIIHIKAEVFPTSPWIHMLICMCCLKIFVCQLCHSGWAVIKSQPCNSKLWVPLQPCTAFLRSW